MSASRRSSASFMADLPGGEEDRGAPQLAALRSRVPVEMGEGRTPRPRPARGSRLRACSAIFFLRTRSRTDALLDRAQAVNLSPPTGRSAGRTSALFVLEARGGETSRTLTA